MIVTLERVTLIHPLGDLGDRNIQGISTAIESNDWHIEAVMRDGEARDVLLYRNIVSHIKDAEPDWRYHCSIPTANIKAFKLLVPPPPAMIVTVDEELEEFSSEPQAKAPTPATGKTQATL